MVIIMKCQKCGKNEANTHVKRVINGEFEEYHLCSRISQQALRMISIRCSEAFSRMLYPPEHRRRAVKPAARPTMISPEQV